jgi:hypothetical protein
VATSFPYDRDTFIDIHTFSSFFYHDVKLLSAFVIASASSSSASIASFQWGFKKCFSRWFKNARKESISRDFIVFFHQLL